MPVNVVSKWHVQVRRETNSRLSVYEPILGRWPGRIGDYSGNVQNPSYPPGYIYVRGLKGDLMTMWNEHAPNVWDLPVVYGYESTEPKLLQVLYQWTSYNQQPFTTIPPHAPSHQFGGSDTVWVYGAQFVPFDAIVSGTFQITLFPGIANTGNYNFTSLLSQTVDLTTHVPALGARITLVTMHSDGSIILTDGAIVDSPDQLTMASIPVPADLTDLPICAVRLYASQSKLVQTVSYTDVFDLRSVVSSGASSWGRVGGYINSQLDLFLQLTARNGGHEHGLYRWIAQGGTTFELPDYAAVLLNVFDNGSSVDGLTVNLSTDGSQVIFNSAPTAGHVVQVEYVLAQR